MKKNNYKRVLLFATLLFGIFMIMPNSVMAVSKVSCGGIDKLPLKIPQLSTLVIRALQIAVPIILVVAGSIDLAKSAASGKEDNMKKYRKLFFKKLIIGVLVFFIIAITKLLISIVADGNKSQKTMSELDEVIDCVDCFTNYKSCTKSDG